MFSSAKQTKWVTTPEGKEGGNVKYLYHDNLNIKCDPDYALSKAIYERSKTNKQDIRYSYTCNSFPGPKGETVSTHKTDEASIGSGGAHVLKNLKVDCKNKPLTSFRLRPSTDPTKIYYEYTCGNTELLKPKLIKSEYFDTDATNGYPTYDLDGSGLDCGRNILTAFSLDPKSDNSQYRYQYTCVEKPGWPLWVWILIMGVMLIILGTIIGFGYRAWYKKNPTYQYPSAEKGIFETEAVEELREQQKKIQPQKKKTSLTLPFKEDTPEKVIEGTDHYIKYGYPQHWQAQQKKEWEALLKKKECEALLKKK